MFLTLPWKILSKMAQQKSSLIKESKIMDDIIRDKNLQDFQSATVVEITDLSKREGKVVFIRPRAPLNIQVQIYEISCKQRKL